MQTYAQFYTMSTGYIAGTIPPKFGEPKLIAACSDRSIIRIDGRLLESFMHHIARTECLKRGYIGYQLIKGESLSSAKPISDVVIVK